MVYIMMGFLVSAPKGETYLVSVHEGNHYSAGNVAVYITLSLYSFRYITMLSAWTLQQKGVTSLGFNTLAKEIHIGRYIAIPSVTTVEQFE